MTDDQIRRCIGLSAAAGGMRGRGGKPASLDSVRRWADPARGYRPRGYTGPALVLATSRLGGDVVTLPEWVAEFEAARFALGTTRVVPRLPAGRRELLSQRKAEEYLDAQGVK